MSSFSLIVVDQSASGSYHVKILVDEKDSGILYVTPEQFDFVVKAFWKNCTVEGISFNVENPFDENTFDTLDQDDDE